MKDTILKALDDLVTVNSFFTASVFIGLSFASPNQHSLESTDRPECDTDPKMAKRLVVYEVVSFSSFLLSSLVAKSLKVYLSMFYDKKPGNETKENKNDGIDDGEDKLFNKGRGSMFGLSIVASTVGMLFLTISMVYIIEIKVGKLSCGIHETKAAVIALTVIVPFALIIYLCSMSLAVVYSTIKP